MADASPAAASPSSTMRGGTFGSSFKPSHSHGRARFPQNGKRKSGASSGAKEGAKAPAAEAEAGASPLSSWCMGLMLFLVLAFPLVRLLSLAQGREDVRGARARRGGGRARRAVARGRGCSAPAGARWRARNMLAFHSQSPPAQPIARNSVWAPVAAAVSVGQGAGGKILVVFREFFAHRPLVHVHNILRKVSFSIGLVAQSSGVLRIS